MEAVQSGKSAASIPKLDEFRASLAKAGLKEAGLEEYGASQVDLITTTDFVLGKSQYLKNLEENTYEAVAVEIHGSITTQWVGGAVDINPMEIQAAAPSAFYIDITACSNGDFSETGYMAGWFLFSGKTMLVQATVEPFWTTGLVNDGKFRGTVPATLMALREGAPAYDVMRLNRRQQLIKQTFGDPTLRLHRPANFGGPRVASAERIDMGRARGGGKKDGGGMI